jgi:hypothetical protein
MKRLIALAVLGVSTLPVTANAQHKFVYRAEFTAEGLKDLQKRSAVGLRTNVIKATESAGCKQEYWYFDPLTSTAYGGADCQSDGAPATAVNAAGFVKLTYRAVLTAEQLDALVAKNPNYRVPQNR